MTEPNAPNPYTPTASTEDSLRGVLAPPWYRGVRGVLLVGVCLGAVIGLILTTQIDASGPSLTFITCWFGMILGAFVLLSYSSTPIDFPRRFFWAIFLSMPAFVLFVPVCAVASVFSMEVIGAKGYGPTTIGLITASALAAPLAMLAVAGIIRVKFREKAGAPQHQSLMTDAEENQA